MHLLQMATPCYKNKNSLFIVFYLINLTAKSVQVGTKNSCSDDFWLVKHIALKHLNHDRAVCLSSDVIFMAEFTPALGASAKRGWPSPQSKGLVLNNILNKKLIFFYWTLCQCQQLLARCQQR
jgi:hypothetical protein